MGGGPSKWVERPASRLSNRTTWKPRPASCSHQSSLQAIICIPRPITSSAGGSDGSPNDSWHRLTPPPGVAEALAHAPTVPLGLAGSGGTAGRSTAPAPSMRLRHASRTTRRHLRLRRRVSGRGRPRAGGRADHRQRVVVETGGGSAVVQRAPFRLAFRDRTAGPCSARWPIGAAAPAALPPTRDPEPFGLELQPDNATYAPLSFEVGTEFRDQWNAGLWNGNLLFSRRSGTVHSARSVVSLRRAGRGVRMLVSTSDRVAPAEGPDHPRQGAARCGCGCGPTSRRGASSRSATRSSRAAARASTDSAAATAP